MRKNSLCRLSINLSWLLLTAGLAIDSAIVRADLIVPADFALFVTHSNAQAQPTERGRTIGNITHFNGQFYAGYGDWSADTGPIAIVSVNASTGALSTPHLNFGTEEVAHYREYSGQLYASNYDPLGPPGLNLGGYAVGNSLHQWSQINSVSPATHVFDIMHTSSGEVWMTGSILTQAAVWRSVDGGQTFSQSRLDNPAPPNTFARYFGLAELNGSVFVQRVDYNANQVNESLVFDGQNWNTGPNLVPNGDGHFVRPSNFAGGLVYVDHDRVDRNLKFFDGTTVHTSLVDAIWDYTISGGELFVLKENGELWRSTDALVWQLFGTAPDDARSLALLNGTIFLGTTDSKILRSKVAISVVPEPASVWILLYLSAWLGCFRRGVRSAKVWPVLGTQPA